MLSNSKQSGPFNLLHEIGKEGVYHMLFPLPQAGLAVLELYTKVKLGLFVNNQFKEQDIYDALENARFINREEEYDRLPGLRFNSIINDLQAYFLRYDPDNQLYTLKDYAEVFCKHAEETLMANFNPTQIELICNALKDQLEKCQNAGEVKSWVETYFDTFKPQMKSQVDRLERQIDQSVKDIRATTQLEDASLIEILKSIDEKLDTIREQNKELRSAFREMKTINRILDRYALTDNGIAFGDLISEVKKFFPEIKYTLGLIDKRLDRIQPKLRQFFGMLNKPTFNVKVEKFLKFLLYSSKVVHGKVEFTQGIPVYQLTQATTNFTIFERRNDLFPPTPRPRTKTTERPKEKEKEILVARQQLVMYNLVDQQVRQILVAAREKEVVYSDYFFDLLGGAGNGLELATKVAYALIRMAAIDKRLKLETTAIKASNAAYPNVSMLEIKIKYEA